MGINELGSGHQPIVDYPLIYVAHMTISTQWVCWIQCHFPNRAGPTWQCLRGTALHIRKWDIRKRCCLWLSEQNHMCHQCYTRQLSHNREMINHCMHTWNLLASCLRICLHYNVSDAMPVWPWSQHRSGRCTAKDNSAERHQCTVPIRKHCVLRLPLRFPMDAWSSQH